MLNKIIAKYSHDYRDIAMNEFDLAVMLENFLEEYKDNEYQEITDEHNRKFGDHSEDNFAVKSSEATEEDIQESNRLVANDKAND